MDLAEYARHDALGLAALVATKQVSPKELAATARRAIDAANPAVNAVVELYEDRIAAPEAAPLGDGPLRGVPFLMKDVAGHEQGRTVEFGSRLAAGFVKTDADTHIAEMIRASGVSIIGRTNAPEYSISGTTENALYGATSTPWKQGYSAGGSSGGSMAAVVAGMVPIAQGGDIAGSIRIPASWSGGVGLKPSRGRVSFGPQMDEGGFGLLMNFVQTKSVRDTAVMLDCMARPQVGDPFAIPRPQASYADVIKQDSGRLRIGFSLDPLMGIAVEPEVAATVKRTAALLADMGHVVEEAGPRYDGRAAARRFLDVWFAGFDVRANMLAARTGHVVGPDTLEPTTLLAYEHAKRLKVADVLSALSAINAARRQLGAFFATYDLWLSPTTAVVSPPHGTCHLGRADPTLEAVIDNQYAVAFQYTLPHNLMGTPAISLPLALTAAGLPIGIQLGARPGQDHVVLQLAAALEEAMPWCDRIPPLHVSKL